MSTITKDTAQSTEQTRILYVYSSLAFLSLTIFGTLHIFVENNQVLGMLEVIGGLVALLIAIGLRAVNNIFLARNLLLLTIFTMLIVMLFTGGTANTGIFWFFLFPVSAFFLTDKKAGLWWMLALFAFIGLVVCLAYLGLLTTPYSLITLRQLLVSLVVITIGIYVYQQSRENSNSTSKEEKIKADIIIDNIGEGVIAVDNRGQIMLASNAACDMLGWQKGELKNKLFTDAVPMVNSLGHKVPVSMRAVTRSLQQGEDTRLDTMYLRKDGSTLLTQITTRAIVVDGKIHGAIVTFRDTTAEHAVDRAKSEFVTLASHQLRTPISAIAWIGELLIHGDAGKLKPEQLDYMRQIYQSNKRMASLVDAMLTASSLELGNLPVRPEPVDLAKLCREVLQQRFEALPADKIIHIKERYDPGLPKVSFDPEITKTILQNLIANAFKYTKSNGTVAVSIKKADDSIVIEVSDNGLGIPEKQQSKIFTKLFRADNVLHQDTDGTGLGLYIVKAAIEYIGGSISFTSKENKGTTFTVSLPLMGMLAKQGGTQYGNAA